MTGLPFTDTHVHFRDFSQPNLRWDWLAPDVNDAELGNYDAIKSRATSRKTSQRRHDFTTSGMLFMFRLRWVPRPGNRDGMASAVCRQVEFHTASSPTQTWQQPTSERFLQGIRPSRTFAGSGICAMTAILPTSHGSAGFSLLQEYGLVFCDDPLLEHMDALAELANRFPGVTICVDHADSRVNGGAEYFKRWANI
jgi:predicted TIM-barrel fold metal-dependent hydrolase